MKIFLFLMLFSTKIARPITPVVSPDTLREGTYHWISGSRCCEPLVTTLRIKRYAPNRYYIVNDYFDTLQEPQRCTFSCSGIFAVEWQAGKTTILQKTESGWEEEVDSLQIQPVGNMILFRQFSKKSEINLNQQFKYVGELKYPLFKMDIYRAFFYKPNFSKPIKIKCYEYPDETLKPRVIEIEPQNWVVQRWTIHDVKNVNKGFELVYFDFIDRGYYHDHGSWFESFNHHLWIRKKDFLKYFTHLKYWH